MDINYERIAQACKRAEVRCSELPLGHHHGAAWLYDQVMRVFDHPAATSVTYEVYINMVGEGTIEIGRDGSLVMRAKH